MSFAWSFPSPCFGWLYSHVAVALAWLLQRTPLHHRQLRHWAEVLFHYRFRSRQIFGVTKDFFPNFPKVPRKVFCATFAYKFSPTKITFCWCDFQQRSSCVFMQTLSTIFWSKATLGAIFTRIFRDVAQMFSKSKLLRCACTPTSSTTPFHNSIISNFVVYQDRLEINSLQLFEHLENSEWFSMISVIIFAVNIVDEQKQSQYVTIFLFFISFRCPQLFYCSPSAPDFCGGQGARTMFMCLAICTTCACHLVIFISEETSLFEDGVFVRCSKGCCGGTLGCQHHFPFYVWYFQLIFTKRQASAQLCLIIWIRHSLLASKLKTLSWLESFNIRPHIHSPTFVPAFPLGKVALAAVLGEPEIPHNQQQSHIVLLAPHQDKKSKVGDVVTPPGRWTTSEPLSRACNCRPGVENQRPAWTFDRAHIRIFFTQIRVQNRINMKLRDKQVLKIVCHKKPVSLVVR